MSKFKDSRVYFQKLRDIRVKPFQAFRSQLSCNERNVKMLKTYAMSPFFIQLNLGPMNEIILLATWKNRTLICAQRRFKSASASAQTDLNLRTKAHDV